MKKKKKKKKIERRSYGDKELVMDQARKHLKDTNLVPRAFPLKNGWGPTQFLREKLWGRGWKDTEFHVYDDIPKLLYDSRNGQMKKLQKARGKGFTDYFTNFFSCSILH